MKLDDELKAKIDSYTYKELLRGWRDAVISDPRFRGQVGDYWKERMAYMRQVEQLIEDYGPEAERLIRDAYAWLHERATTVWHLEYFDYEEVVRDLLNQAHFIRRSNVVDIHVRASKAIG